MAEHNLKCPKCDKVQSAGNGKCVNCGHDLADARKAKFASLGEWALLESWSDAARVAALAARKRKGNAGVVALVKSGEHPPVRIANVLPAQHVRPLIEHIEKREDMRDPKVRKLHRALKQRLAPVPVAVPDIITHIQNVVRQVGDRRVALQHALAVEALFDEVLHPRQRSGKFRDKLGVPHSKSDIVRRSHGLRAVPNDVYERDRSYDASGGLPAGSTAVVTRDHPIHSGHHAKAGDRVRIISHSNAGSRGIESYVENKRTGGKFNISAGVLDHPSGKASPGVRTHYNAEGEGGKPRNVKAMGDKKLRHLLTHPATPLELRARVRAEIVRRGGDVPSEPTPRLARVERVPLDQVFRDRNETPRDLGGGVRSHTETTGPKGKPRNVGRMGDKKLRTLLAHPDTHPDLREQVRAEIVRRGDVAAAGESRGHIAGSASTEARPSGRPPSKRPDERAVTAEDLMARLPSAKGKREVLSPASERKVGVEVLDHVAKPDVREMVRTASDFGHLDLATAIQRGEVTSDHVDALTRLADDAGRNLFDPNEHTQKRMQRVQRNAERLRRGLKGA